MTIGQNFSMYRVSVSRRGYRGSHVNKTEATSAPALLKQPTATKRLPPPPPPQAGTLTLSVRAGSQEGWVNLGLKGL